MISAQSKDETTKHGRVWLMHHRLLNERLNTKSISTQCRITVLAQHIILTGDADNADMGPYCIHLQLESSYNR